MSAHPTMQDLPDYSSICQVREALWGQNEVRGAAVMVGAGFSRSAKRVSQPTRVPPLWSTFEKEMLARLYPGSSKFYDPMKLAEEYRAALGQHALDALIRRLVPDEQWMPSALHGRLLSLPWADVLTTNWDTLLERTTLRDPDKSYDVVRTVTDIARTRSPRIVKLHGSLPSHLPFIFTSEDFRTYPRKFAAFINLAQQVLLENELCLLGFSGDDPNFLQWAGWVRDQLGDNARRIRLVGALNISASQRQVLEQHNVSPIDLGPLVNGLEPDDAHQTATRLFLDALWAAKPKPAHEWTRTPVPHQAPTGAAPDEIVRQLTETWEADRLGYPGWLVAPSHHRQFLRMETNRWYREMRTALPKAAVHLRVKAVAELAWRYETALWPLDDFMRDTFASELNEKGKDAFSKSDRIRVIAALLADARHNHNWQDFDKWLAALESADDPEAITICRYQQALRAKNEFNFEKLSEFLSFVKGDDPVWQLRRAYLHCALCEDQQAAEAIQQAQRKLHELRARERNSIWLLSREAWASWLMRCARWELRQADEEIDDVSWPTKYHATDCDPWDHLHDIDRAVSKEWEKRLADAVVIEPRFDAGSYRDHSKSVTFTSGSTTLVLDELIQLAETVGLSDRIGHTGVLSDRIARAIQVTPTISAPLIWLAANHLPSESKGLINRMFSRVDVARLPDDIVIEISEKLRAAIEYGLHKLAAGNNSWVEQTRIFLELLSRLMIRHKPEEAKEAFLWSMKISEHTGLSHWWLSEPLSNLLHRSLEAVPPSLRGQLSFECLRLRLPREKKIGGIEQRWPELSQAFEPEDFKVRDTGPNWDWRIAELIEVVRVGETLDRSLALLRLSLLMEADVLRPGEMSLLATAIWDRRSGEDGLPNHNELYAHMFLMLPEPAEAVSCSAFHKWVVEPLVRGEISISNLIAVHGASSKRFNGRYKLKAEDALAMFKACIGWKPPVRNAPDYWIDVGRVEDAIDREIGYCLTWAVLPNLTPEMFDTSLIEQWFSAIESNDVPSLLVTSAHLAHMSPTDAERAIKLVRKGLAGRHEATVVAGIDAVAHFLTLRKRTGLTVPAVFSADIVGMCATRREPGLLHSLSAARHLLTADLLNEDEQHRLIDSLELLLLDLDYEQWDISDSRTKALSLIRGECVRLAVALKSRGRCEPPVLAWLTAQSNDAFPEVRFAELKEPD
ncbi:SIR2 family NAD-dependent protein deacylase [Rhizobium sp. LjRoot254]|uniref:SIR2 family NAD-dependent protein deacylase n=1 Tax=Rhizobium sp. LjRoot254 TaxID=3342297 RepID=UPI003ED03A0C